MYFLLLDVEGLEFTKSEILNYFQIDADKQLSLICSFYMCLIIVCYFSVILIISLR